MTAKSNVAEKDKAAQKKNDKMLPDGPDWTFNLLEQYHVEIKRVAQHYRLDTYPNQIEVITSEQMMDAYSSIGMPINYNHWSFGKKFIQTEQNYKHGQMGLSVRNRDQFRSLYRLSDGREHGHYAGTSNGARLLRP